MSEWFYQSMSSEHGPYSAAEMREHTAAGRIVSDTPVRKGHDGRWVSASSVKGLVDDAPQEAAPKQIDFSAIEGNPEPPPPPKAKGGCPRCGKPTSFFDRDLFSGLCSECQAADRDRRIEQSLKRVDAAVGEKSHRSSGTRLCDVFGVATIVAGIVAAIMLFVAADKFDEHGRQLTGLRSQSGGTVQEEYFQQIGFFGIAYGSLSRAAGVGVAAISLGLGGLLIARE